MTRPPPPPFTAESAAQKAHLSEGNKLLYQQSTKRPRVVIIGAGFGGLETAKRLKDTPVEITLIDRRNYHLFQPLLYQVATAGLSPADIAWPVRSLLSGQRNLRVVLGRVTGVDTRGNEVIIEERRLGYDYLVIATGARHSYFGREDWENVAPGLKKIEDATDIRRRVLMAFELAEVTEDLEDRRALLTFVVVGGGPTGVEMAGAIAELARHALAADFRNIDTSSTRVILVEAGPRVLAAFPERLSAIARRSLERLGVEVRNDARVTVCDADGVAVGEERIAARTIVWAAGVMASPAGKWLGAEVDRAGRILVTASLSVPNHPHVFVIGDTAAVANPDGLPVPGLAPAAKQMGTYVARLIAARTAGCRESGRFVYKHQGNLATIGRKAAVVQIGRLQISGLIAWVFWSLVDVFPDWGQAPDRCGYQLDLELRHVRSWCALNRRRRSR
jgi:NADH dehydrogenase